MVDWASDRALFKSAVEVFPGNCKMHHNYATTLSDETVGFVLMCAWLYVLTLVRALSGS